MNISWIKYVNIIFFVVGILFIGHLLLSYQQAYNLAHIGQIQTNSLSILYNHTLSNIGEPSIVNNHPIYNTAFAILQYANNDVDHIIINMDQRHSFNINFLLCYVILYCIFSIIKTKVKYKHPLKEDNPMEYNI